MSVSTTYQRIEDLALACEHSAGGIHFHGDDKKQLGADLRALLTEVSNGWKKKLRNPAEINRRYCKPMSRAQIAKMEKRLREEREYLKQGLISEIEDNVRTDKIVNMPIQEYIRINAQESRAKTRYLNEVGRFIEETGSYDVGRIQDFLYWGQVKQIRGLGRKLQNELAALFRRDGFESWCFDVPAGPDTP